MVDLRSAKKAESGGGATAYIQATRGIINECTTRRLGRKDDECAKTMSYEVAVGCSDQRPGLENSSIFLVQWRAMQ